MSERSRNIPHHSLDTLQPCLQHDLFMAPAMDSFLQDLHRLRVWLWLFNSVKQSYDLRVIAFPHRLNTCVRKRTTDHVSHYKISRFRSVFVKA